MKKTFLVCTFLMISSLSALEFNLEECLVQAKEYSGKNVVEEGCFSTIANNIDSISVSNKGVDVFGLKGLLYLKKGDHVQLISGSNSQLSNILAIDLDHARKQIAVLNQDPDGKLSLMIFNSTRNGNIGPHKVIKTQEVNDAQDILFAANGKKILLMQSKKVIAYSTDMDSRSPRVAQKPRVLNQFGSMTAPIAEPENSIITQKHFINLNTKTKQVSIYLLSDPKTAKPAFVLDNIKNNFRAPASISLNQKGDKLIIQDEEIGEIKFNLKEFDKNYNESAETLSH